MKKLAFFLGLAIVIFVSAQVAQATQVIDDTLQVNSLKVGQQGIGGVTFFNGTILNETTGNNEADNPVTFGDNVRIDGRVYRGATAGIDDTQPFIISDNAEIEGDLTVKGDLTVDGSSALKKKVYSGTFDFAEEGDIQKTVGGYTYYWKTVSVPVIDTSEMPIVQVFTGTPAGAPGIYPDLENSYVNISYMIANFLVEDGKVHILFGVNSGSGIDPLYNSEDYKIVVIY